MSKVTQDEKSFLNMAGEFLVAAELNRRRILSAVTYGSSKSADVWAFDSQSQRAARIEVKTTGEGSKSWVIGMKPVANRDKWLKDVFWVLVLLPVASSDGPPKDDAERGRRSPRFFVFSDHEMGGLVCTQHDAYCDKYLAKHGSKFRGIGVPKMFLKQATPYESQWAKIETRVRAVSQD